MTESEIRYEMYTGRSGNCECPDFNVAEQVTCVYCDALREFWDYMAIATVCDEWAEDRATDNGNRWRGVVLFWGGMSDG